MGVTLEQDNKLIRSLVQNAKAGNNVAFEQLYQMNVGRVYALCLRLTSDPRLAQHLTVEVFLSTWKQFRLMRSDVPFTSWLIGIAVYEALEEMRSHKLEEELKNKKNSGGDLPAKNRSKTLIENRMESMIMELQQEERIAFVLHEMEKYSLQETAELLGITGRKAQTILAEAAKSLGGSDGFIGALKQTMDERIKMLPLKIDPPVDLWEEIFQYINSLKSEAVRKEEEQREAEEAAAAEAAKESKEEKRYRKLKEKEEKKQKKRKEKGKSKVSLSRAQKKYLKIGIRSVLVIVFVAAVYYLFFSPGNGWQVTNSGGVTTLGRKLVTGSAIMYKDGELSTGESSEATVFIPQIGRIFVKQDTRLTRLGGKYRFKLQTGTIYVIKKDASAFLHVEIPGGEVEDYFLGGSYTLTVEEGIVSKLFEGDGWDLVTSYGGESLVPPNYYCEVRPNIAPGIPYSKDASEELKKAVYQLSFERDDNTLISTILKEAKKHDAVTLWNLIKRTRETDRGRIFDKLNGLVQAPSGVTKDGVVKLNKVMMQKWLAVMGG